MAIENAAFTATLAAAAGDDPELLTELRGAFRDSLAQQIDLLRRSRCDGNWLIAAQRIKGLAASFHAGELIVLAQGAIDAAPGDPVALRKLGGFLADFDRVSAA
ncbi:Hpt domain-containing protein [Alteriqipengyuania sp. 357]